MKKTKNTKYTFAIGNAHWSNFYSHIGNAVGYGYDGRWAVRIDRLAKEGYRQERIRQQLYFLLSHMVQLDKKGDDVFRIKTLHGIIGYIQKHVRIVEKMEIGVPEEKLIPKLTHAIYKTSVEELIHSIGDYAHPTLIVIYDKKSSTVKKARKQLEESSIGGKIVQYDDSFGIKLRDYSAKREENVDNFIKGLRKNLPRKIKIRQRIPANELEKLLSTL